MAADPGAGFPDLASRSRVSEESIPQRRGKKNASELSRRYHPATACGILLGGRMRKDVALRTGEARLSPLYRPAVRDPTPYIRPTEVTVQNISDAVFEAISSALSEAVFRTLKQL